MSDGSDNGVEPSQSTGGGTSFKPSPPSDTPGDNDTGGQPGGSSSLVSNLIETGLGGGDGSGLNLEVGFSGNDNAGFNLSADHSQDGLNIDVDGGASDGGLVGVRGLADLGGLVGDSGSLIDIDFDQDDGQTAAILDVVGSSDGDAQAAVLGSDITAGSGFDILGSPGLLDGILEDVIS